MATTNTAPTVAAPYLMTESTALVVSFGSGVYTHAAFQLSRIRRTAGSLTMSSPAIQPRRAAPAQTSAGAFVNNHMTSVAPKMINGIEVRRPMMISVQLPFAAAAIATTLSRLMTRSAMAIVRTAPQTLLDSLTSFSSPSSTSSLIAIQKSNRLPMVINQGTASN